MNLVYLIYREVHYRILQRNPLITRNAKRYNDALKNALSMWRGLGYQSISYVFLGLFSAMGIAFTMNKEVISSMAVFLGILPFVFAIYITAIQGTNVVYMGIFEPMKMLPVKIGSKYLSLYLLAEIFPSFVIVLPTSIVIMMKYPLEGALSLVWFVMGMLLGHVIGLTILNFFGLKIRQRAGKKETLASIFRAIFLFLFIAMFYAVIYLQDYIKEHSGEWGEFISKYSIVYPFSIGTIFVPAYSFLLLLIYGVVIAGFYYVLLRRIWGRIIEPRIVSEKVEISAFKAEKMSPIRTLFIKDFKILLRKTALLAGFLVPIYIVFPQIFFALSSGKYPESQLLATIFMLGVFAATGTDAILKLESMSLDFLRTLPLRKRDFVSAKIFSMCVVPWALGLLILLLGLYYNGIPALSLLPLPILLPPISASVSMLYYFRYKGEEIGIPDLKWSNFIVLLLIIGAVMGVIAVPILFGHVYLGEIIAVLVLFILLLLVRNL